MAGETKPAIKSATIVTALVTLAAAVAASFGVDPIGIEDQGAIVAGALALIGIALRFKTKGAITLK